MYISEFWCGVIATIGYAIQLDINKKKKEKK